MIKLTILLALFILAQSASGELLFSPRPSTNKITVADGEAIVFTSFSGDIGVCEVTLLSGGKSDEVYFPVSSQRFGAVAGPCQLIVRNLTGSFVTEFIRTPNNSIKTVIVGGSIVTNGIRVSRERVIIEVAAGQAVRFFTPGVNSLEAKFRVGGLSTSERELAPNTEVSGPVSITLIRRGDRGILVSYTITDSPSLLPELGLIKIHGGSHEVAIEKSLDLKTWNTVLSAPVTTSGEGFFRLRVVK